MARTGRPKQPLVLSDDGPQPGPIGHRGADPLGKGRCRRLPATAAPPGLGPVLADHRGGDGDVDHLAALVGDDLGVGQAGATVTACPRGVLDDLVGSIGHLQGAALGPGLLSGPSLPAGPGLLLLAFLGLAGTFGYRVTRRRLRGVAGVLRRIRPQPSVLRRQSLVVCRQRLDPGEQLDDQRHQLSVLQAEHLVGRHGRRRWLRRLGASGAGGR